MTVWRVKKLYHGDDAKYTVLPYNLFSAIRITLRMKNGFKATMEFLKNMTVWRVKKLYHGDDAKYTVLPYNLFSAIRITLRMKNGFKATMEFLKNSCFTESAAEKLSRKLERKLLKNNMVIK